MFHVDYLGSVGTRRVFPDKEALDGLAAFDESFPEKGHDEMSTLALLDDAGTPATSTSNGPHYYSFVIGATLPVADAAERLALACAAG